MPVQVWDRTGTKFYGQLMEPGKGGITMAINQAASIDISAPYEKWREIMSITPRFHRLIVTGPNGEAMITGYWHTRDDDPHVPGSMAIGGSGLLDELRVPCLPTEYVFQDQSVLGILAGILSYADGWSLGDTSLAQDVLLSASFSGETVLDSFITICESTGHFMRCDSKTRKIDVFAEPFPEIVANIVVAAPEVELELPSGVGRILEASATEDCGELLRAVVPIGADYKDQTDKDKILQLTGNEELPSGFSFEQIAGQLCVVNDAVDYGLVRQVEFQNVAALSNTEVSASGAIESSGAGTITSVACRRPNDGFWEGGVLEIIETEYRVAGHSGDTVSGQWPEFTDGTPFTLRKEFPYDESAITEARDALVAASTGYLKQNSEPKALINVVVTGLDRMPLPGEQVHLECVAFAEVRDKLTDTVSRFLHDGFYGDMIVIVSEAQFGTPDLRFGMDLSNKLAQGPTDPGVSELRTLTPKRLKGSRARGRGAAYTIRITDAGTSCGTNGYENSLDFTEAYPSTPEVMEVVPLDERYTAYVVSISPTSVRVCAECTSGAFDEVNVIVRVREP